MAQSSVQHFWDKIALKLSVDQINDFIPLFEQAKAMHKEEIIEAGSDHCYPTCELAKFDAEKYYNDTFGGEDDKSKGLPG